MSREHLTEVRTAIQQVQDLHPIAKQYMKDTLQRLEQEEESTEYTLICEETAATLNHMQRNFDQAIADMANQHSTSRFVVKIKRGWLGKLSRHVERAQPQTNTQTA